MAIFADLDVDGRPVRFLVLADDAKAPDAMVRVTPDEWRDLLAGQAAAALDLTAPDGARVVARVVPVVTPPTPAERAAAELAASPMLGAVISELAARFGVTRAALLTSIANRVTP